MGRVSYGVELKTFNGRDALLDAVEEAADLFLYLLQAYTEAECRKSPMTSTTKDL